MVTLCISELLLKSALGTHCSVYISLDDVHLYMQLVSITFKATTAVPQSAQIKDHQIVICCFSAKLAALRNKSKYWLVWNNDNVFLRGATCLPADLFQWAITVKIQLSVLVKYRADIIIISWNVICSRLIELQKYLIWHLNKNHSINRVLVVLLWYSGLMHWCGILIYMYNSCFHSLL